MAEIQLETSDFQRQDQRRLQQENTLASADADDLLTRPTFNVWKLQKEEMVDLLARMFRQLDFFEHLRMEEETLHNFLESVQSRYRENPFHNFRHAFCVTQMMYSLIQLCHLQEALSIEDIAVLMVASLCHDVDHPGLSNTYQVNAHTELAVRYENKSPLENHHCSVTLHILSQLQSNIFCNTSPHTSRYIQEGITELILATDMTHHSTILQALQQIQNLDFSDRDHMTWVKKSLLKFCDISNEVRPAEQAEIWADALMEEYFQQSDLEKTEGLPVTPYMDRETVTKAISQKTFIQFLLLPLCKALCEIFPELKAWTMEPLREAMLRYEKQTGQQTESA
ncbi:high affinity cGMP-specific 3',5'-cyclic phosphodiesterase 9A [Hyperolius riggenbachi]|uniref:high affinity cGMP-specific 3',5'-cyclic phosphodiesterase 9A n=1 Tax=Hyperolius riggenbachi TaxID=752182 RepID=UPI0035A3AC91